MRFAVLLLPIFFLCPNCKAQHLKYNAFTVTDGLPSNYIYRCVEDNKGFLWVATDAGIARFDGKHFQVFTTQDGLPDNEVLSVVKEKNGRIWVNCFKQKPAYFDEIKNRFINAKQDGSLEKLQEGTGIMYFFPLDSGGIMFYNEKGSFIYKDKNLLAYPTGKRHEGFLIKENQDGSQLKFGYYYRVQGDGTKIFQAKIYQESGKIYNDSSVIRNYNHGGSLTSGFSGGKFYLFDGVSGKCFIYSNFDTHPIRYEVDSVKIPEPFNNFEFTADCFYLLGISGKIYLFDKENLQVAASVSGNYLCNSIYRDSKGNLWVSTIDKGLLVYKKRQFDTICMPKGFIRTDFLSIARKKDGKVLAGNFYGDVLEADRKGAKVNTIPKKGILARQRKILFSQNKVFTFSEAGVYVDYKKGLETYGKTAIAYNDSTIIVGQSYSLIKLNSITEKVTTLNVRKRITALTRDANGIIYFGSTDGLYKYVYNNDKTLALNQTNPLLQERITGLCASPDNLIWTATSGNGVVVMKDDKVLLHISEKDGTINNSIRCITNGMPGQVWLGTAAGISVINYKLQNQYTIGFTIQNLSLHDGLTSNVINDMLFDKDTIYAATANGISVIPANVSIPKFDIPVELVRVHINQRDTILSSSYKLGYDQQNIQMEFAGIELNGHFRNFQYTLDKNKTWVTLNENLLTVEFSSGYHAVQVRAVDVNGNISKKILAIKFDIAAPFWKAIWFWLIVAFFMQGLTLYFVARRQKKRKEIKLAKEIIEVQMASLEQQAFTSLMNPHFMFNALNSIQHYINIQDRQNANRYLTDFASLIRKNFEAAQQSFVPLDQEMENIKIYLRLEQMRFSNRFSYQITIDDNLDTEDWMVPSMVLQPLLENALLHGIMPSPGTGKIAIDMKGLERNLLITITDNGVGIANSNALKETDSRHKSHGIELIKKRIAALSHFGPLAITLSMAPAFPGQKNPGNKVSLFIPFDLHNAWLKVQKR